MSLFEALMLLCFGAAWPFSIIKSWESRSNRGKSLVFLVVVFAGYLSGCIHKVAYDLDPVLWLYVFNGLMVFTDIGLYVRNWRISLPAAVA